MATETGTQAIDRAAQLLVRVVESARAPSIGELAEREGLPKSTTSRLVAALERQGLVQRLGDRGRLRPGPVLLRYASRDGAGTLVELAGPSLRRLAEASGETINLAVPGPDGVEHLAQEDTAHSRRRHRLGRAARAVRARGQRQGFLAFGRAAPQQLDRSRRRRYDRARTAARDRARGYATAVDELEARPLRDRRSGLRRRRAPRRRALDLRTDHQARPTSASRSSRRC